MKRQRPHMDPDAWVDGLRVSVREEFEKTGEVHPRALLLATREPKTGLFLPQASIALIWPEQMGSRNSKDAFVNCVRDMVKKCDALAYAIVNEAWHAPGPEAAEFAQHNSLEEWPGVQEVVMISYQKIGTERTRVWSAFIKRDGGKVTLGEFREADRAEGRFTGLMPEVS